MGEEISEKLKIIPHEIEVVRTIRKKYVCSCGEYIKIAKLPPTILPKSMATPSLLSYIVTGKYVDGIPLYRFESVMKRHGIDLSRAIMGRWMIEVGEKLKTLKELLREELLFSSSYIHCDETVVQVLKEKDKPPESKSYMWVQARSGDKPIVLYDYNPSRSAKVPMDLLKGFKGYLQVDGYAGYNSIGREEDITRVGCMSHCRRYFFRAWKHSKTKNIGSRGLAFIRKLYKIEESIKEYSEEEKKRIRLEKSKPILEEMKAWLDKEGSRHPVKSLGGKAIHYALNEWEFLIRYLEDGRLNISNAFVERAIRPFTIGRKNWLFSNTSKGADVSTLWYSLIETAKANGHEPFEYILNVLNKIPTANSLEDYMNLLPFNISDKK